MKIITEAITQKQYLKFIYKGLPRIVQPHAYGLFSNSVDMLVGWQIGGERDKGDLPGWGNYLLGGISGESLSGETNKSSKKSSWYK